MSDSELKLSEVKLNKKSITECELVLECNSKFYRLYIDRYNTGFDAMAVEWLGSSYEGDCDDNWNAKSVDVAVLFDLTALFDGVRHLEMSEYTNYPSIQGMIKLFEKVRELEKELCRDCEEDEDV